MKGFLITLSYIVYCMGCISNMYSSTKVEDPFNSKEQLMEEGRIGYMDK